MSSRVFQMLYSGAGNPTAPLDSAFISRVDEAISPLDDAPVHLAGLRPQCWPPQKKYPIYVFEFDPIRLAYVAGPIVQLADRRLWDPLHTLTTLAEEALSGGSLTAGHIVCRECKTPDLGELWECGCEEPSVEPWNHTATVSKNNCYSYAFRKLWCSAWGSTPGGTLPRKGDLGHLKQLIVCDGWEEVTKRELSPNDGYFMALLVGKKVPTNYHFVRLDGVRWTHKVGILLASACDASGRKMPWDDLEGADFDPWWKLEAYYCLRPGSRLDHCLP